MGCLKNWSKEDIQRASVFRTKLLESGERRYKYDNLATFERVEFPDAKLEKFEEIQRQSK